MIPSSGSTHPTLLSIQVLRAGAALGVTICHIVGYEFTKQYGLPNALPSFTIGNAGVDVFFVISGFVMVYSSQPLFERPKAPQEFFLRRLARIVPLYWITTSIILGYLLIQYGDLAKVQFTPEAVVASYLFIPYPQLDGFMAPVHGVGWTLNYEMFFYLCFCLALLFSRLTGVLLVAAALCFLVALNRVLPLPNPLGYLVEPIILEFVFGMLIALIYRSGFRMKSALAAVIVVAALAAIAASGRWNELPRVIVWGLPSACMVGALALAEYSATPNRLWRGLSFLGDASYALYLVHPLAITLPRRVFPRVIDPATSPWLYAALLIATALIAAAVVHVLVEKPITRVLQRRIAQHFRAAKRAQPAGELHPVRE
jgi:exopolysaccharide production protein ExoZ